MKLTATLLLAVTLHLSAKSYSQTVTLKGKRLALYDVFNNISKQTGYEFVYDEKLLQGAAPVNMNVSNAPLTDVLDKCLKGKSLEYAIVNKIIVISPKPAPESVLQAAPIKGTVTGADGKPLFNISIQVKGTIRGTITNEQGGFSIQADKKDVLVFSSIGYETKEITVGNNTTLTVVLNAANTQLTGVLVTALGIKRSEKTITYAMQQVSGGELTKAKDPNLINTLNGKVAGLSISPSGSGIGGSAKVVLRGGKSGVASNQALYVIDGVPMNNSLTNQPSSVFGGSNAYDGGDPISNMNPEDIESISVLKGASAAALYGSQGANGVIIVTTKSGKSGKTQINFSSSANLAQVAYKPEFQNNYGATNATSPQSWGAKLSSPGGDNLSSFFQTGQTYTNSISLSAGSEQMQTYFSYANTAGTGIEPGNKLGRNNINFKETGHFLNNKLTAEADVNYVTQKIDNTPLSGFYLNPLTGLYLFPRGRDIRPFKDQFETPDPTRNFLPVQNWAYLEDIQQNPWWVTKRDPNSLNRNRLLLNASLKYEINSWLNVQARGSIDRINDVYEQKMYAGTYKVLAPANGVYNYNNATTTQQYGDLMLNFNVPINKDLRLTGLVGGALRDLKTSGVKFNSGQDGLKIANIFVIQNFNTMNAVNSGTLPENHGQYQSLFGSANLAWKEMAYLDITARNDWASNLAFTPSNNYFYPSVGLNLILSQMMEMPKAISFLKVRGSYAEVGNSPTNYKSHPADNTFGVGSVTGNPQTPFTNLRPEKTKSLELGMEWRFFDNRLTADITYYKTNTNNQTLNIDASNASYNQVFFFNAGNVQNRGIEAVFHYDVFRGGKFQWNTGINYSVNDNRILELSDINPQIVLSGASGANFMSKFKVGGSFGDIYGTVLQRDAQGRIMIDDKGAPIKQGGDFVYLGNANPKWQLGWNNNLSYGDFSLSFLIDGKFGGQVMSVTQSVMDQYGVSKATGDARDAGGVAVNGVGPNGQPVTSVDPLKWYSSIGGREAVSGEYMYSATVVRLRELSLGYAVPVKNSWVKTLRFNLTGRNLIYFHKKAPYDPEMTMSTANDLSGVDIFMPPATRNYGLSLNATF
ncbi:SusC/RagA family TonB-linked outer membrane protein [Chitinophaga qingshengii]|uniref:SusC/RagA family TonB-linked outer membrane protein n=1 Tax=Chitinophaga qingshengii TaxID=1569794 RepID=A0ABR7TGC4_9BACT|nr:SusC/RagA family TonB-linked outer membrane protein [Chitinophaga qingshengii]MBC9929482.1 SusC/RagA family TonB-linked outer membrane protein [Chitinophaga qingshengii]